MRLLYLPVHRDTQLQRVQQRRSDAPDQTFPITPAELDVWRSQFEVPDDELSDRPPPPAPPPWATWLDWAVNRRPSLSTN